MQVDVGALLEEVDGLAARRGAGGPAKPFSYCLTTAKFTWVFE